MDEIILHKIAKHDEIEVLRARVVRLETALKKQSRLATEWDANKLGGVVIQRKRWWLLVGIARRALENDHE